MASVADRIVPKVKLIDNDGIPLETPWHYLTITLLLDCLRYYLHPRADYYSGGNMFIYYSEAQARHRKYRGPDFFFVDKVDGKRTRRWWAVWEEGGRYPDVIMELLSDSTRRGDLTTKKTLYERTFHTYEYFCCDPEPLRLLGWRLGKGGRYQDIPRNERGWLWCEKLELWIGFWTGTYMDQHGTYPRFYDAQGRLVPTHGEAGELKAEVAQQRAVLAQRQADLAKQEATLEKRRAEKLAAELAQLKAKVTRKRPPNGRGKGGK